MTAAIPEPWAWPSFPILQYELLLQGSVAT